MMSITECIEAYKKINDWELVTSFSVGGFEWLGFSKEKPNNMICISSQKTTILNCDSGEIKECNADYDEQEFIAICDGLSNEQITIAGQYGGNLPLISGKGEQVIIQETKEHIMTITFVSINGEKTIIYYNYSAYICGFSYDGNYFVLADDGGIVIIKRKSQKNAISK